VADFYADTLDGADENTSRKIRIVAAKTGIEQRYSVLEDFSLESTDFLFFPKNKALRPLPGLNERMKVFRKEAVLLSAGAARSIPDFEKIKNDITHIITVTCTGLFAPGLDIELMQVLGLKNDIQRSSINFMGCNAAILALKQSQQICNSQEGAVVLIVCTELCTLHFQKEYTDDYILSNLLFGDGSAAAIESQKQFVSSRFKPIKLTSFHSLVIHEGYKDMAWQLSESGFIMNLTSYVSAILNKNIGKLLQEAGVKLTQIDKWAIHPGGKRILDDFSHNLGIDPSELEVSYKVLREYGNMSSATILFVLRDLMADPTRIKDEMTYAAAFGPGLSIESVFLQDV
jgi:predicted naringenin-chalcone synthase